MESFLPLLLWTMMSRLRRRPLKILDIRVSKSENRREKKKSLRHHFTVQINAHPSQKMLVMGGGLPGTYQFDQLHFHWGAEHTINGVR